MGKLRDCNVILRDAETGVPIAEFYRMRSRTRDNLLAALIIFGAHCHSGQWSRGYRLMCRAQTAWDRRNRRSFPFDYYEETVAADPEHPVSVIYRRLIADYEGRV